MLGNLTIYMYIHSGFYFLSVCLSVELPHSPLGLEYAERSPLEGPSLALFPLGTKWFRKESNKRSKRKKMI